MFFKVTDVVKNIKIIILLRLYISCNIRSKKYGDIITVNSFCIC